MDNKVNEIQINEQPAHAKIIQASCLCGNLLEEVGYRHIDDYPPKGIYKYKCTQCTLEYESEEYFPRVEYDVQYSPREHVRYDKHGYKIGGEPYHMFKEKPYRGKPLSEFEYEILITNHPDHLIIPVWVPIKMKDFMKPTEIPQYIEAGWVRIKSEKAPAKVALEYWRDLYQFEKNKNRSLAAEVIDIRAENTALRAEIDVYKKFGFSVPAEVKGEFYTLLPRSGSTIKLYTDQDAKKFIGYGVFASEPPGEARCEVGENTNEKSFVPKYIDSLTEIQVYQIAQIVWDDIARKPARPENIMPPLGNTIIKWQDAWWLIKFTTRTPRIRIFKDFTTQLFYVNYENNSPLYPSDAAKEMIKTLFSEWGIISGSEND